MNAKIKYIFLIWLFVYSCVKYNLSFAEEVKIYKLGEEPKLNRNCKFERTFTTTNMPKTPFFVRLKYIEEKNIEVKIDGFTLGGTFKREEGKSECFIRIYINNISEKTYKNLQFHIQYFIYDLPEVRAKKGKTHVKRTSNKLTILQNVKFSLPILKPKDQIVIDSPKISIPYKREKFIDDAYDRTHPIFDDTYCYEMGHNIAGYIVSIFDQKGKLLYQQTNKRNLRERGIKNLQYEE